MCQGVLLYLYVAFLELWIYLENEVSSQREKKAKQKTNKESKQTYRTEQTNGQKNVKTKRK